MFFKEGTNLYRSQQEGWILIPVLSFLFLMSLCLISTVKLIFFEYKMSAYFKEYDSLFYKLEETLFLAENNLYMHKMPLSNSLNSNMQACILYFHTLCSWEEISIPVTCKIFSTTKWRIGYIIEPWQYDPCALILGEKRMKGVQYYRITACIKDEHAYSLQLQSSYALSHKHSICLNPTKEHSVSPGRQSWYVPSL